MYTSVASTDLDGDGRPDIAMASSYISGSPPHAGNAVVLLQHHSPFEGVLPPSRYATGNDSKSIFARDVNGDGRPDLVVSNVVTSADSNGTNSISIFVQDGRLDICLATVTGIFVLVQDASAPGTFLPAVEYPAGDQPIAIAMGYLNNDGLPDLVVADYGSPGGQIRGSVHIFLQDPTTPGTLLPANEYATGFRSTSVAIGDLNGDGMVDIAVANPVSSGSNGNISILFQAPGHTGIFLPAVNYPAFSQPLSIAISDLNRDGNADLVVADGGVVICYQDPTQPGVFISPVHLGP